MVMLRRAKALMLCGPSGVGKGTLARMVLEEMGESVALSVSSTTRKPRNGEVHGKDYYFTSREEMEALVKEGRFVEVANVHGQSYGTTKMELERIAALGKIALLDVDVNGVKSIKAVQDVESKCVGIVPPNMEELEGRLRGRHSESEEQIKTRLQNALEEIAFCKTDKRVDALIVNENSWTIGYPKLKSLIHSWWPETKL